jgi:hypothetical protein
MSEINAWPGGSSESSHDLTARSTALSTIFPAARLSAVLLAICTAAALLLPGTAGAVPSFARQTGAACAQCHTTAFGPALTPFGMQFKLNGYVWGNSSKGPPVAAMALASFTNTQSGQTGGAAPHYSSNDNLTIDQISLFVAGRIYGKLGIFGQGTYDGVAKRVAWDNLDVRFADHGSVGPLGVVYGISLNNNPTVQDLWNSTPAWSFPYASSPLAPTPAAAPLLEGGLAQSVLGLTAYAMWNNWVYTEAGAYRSLSLHWQKNLGVIDNVEGNTVVVGPAPYWRAAVQHSFGAHYASAGVFGLAARQQPGGDGSAGTDHLSDLGYDATYQFNGGGPNTFNANLTYIHESQHWDASFALGDTGVAANQLNTLRFNAGWVYRQTYSLSGGPFQVHGGADPVLYADGITGSPNSRGYLAQAEYIPFGKSGSWGRPFANLRLGLQYTYYTEFDGAGANYDGAGRSANDNNTLYGFLWLAF